MVNAKTLYHKQKCITSCLKLNNSLIIEVKSQNLHKCFCHLLNLGFIYFKFLSRVTFSNYKISLNFYFLYDEFNVLILVKTKHTCNNTLTFALGSSRDSLMGTGTLSANFCSSSFSSSRTCNSLNSEEREKIRNRSISVAVSLRSLLYVSIVSKVQ